MLHSMLENTCSDTSRFLNALRYNIFCPKCSVVTLPQRRCNHDMLAIFACKQRSFSYKIFPGKPVALLARHGRRHLKGYM